MLTEQIDEAAGSRGDAPYLEDAAGTATLTYAGLQRSVRAWARHLDEAGIPPGTRVAVRRPDVFGYACALVGIVAAGRVAVPLDPGARGRARFSPGPAVCLGRPRRDLPVHERDDRDAQGHPAR